MNEPTGYTALDLVGYTDRGDYDPTATYVKNDLANSGDTKWRCKVDDTIGVTPTEGVNWTAFIQLPADTTKQIIAPVEVTPSQHAYQVSKQLIFNSTLYTVTSPIAMNDALVVGTNITASDTVIEQVDDNKSDIQTLHDGWQKNGAYNLCPIEATTQVVNGVTYTVNADGTISTSGATTTNTSQLTICNVKLPKGTYKAVGCPTGGSSSPWTYYVIYKKDNASGETLGYDEGNGCTLTLATDTVVNIRIIVNTNTDMSGKVFKPMITTDLNATYADYVPYAMTNRELTENAMFITAGTITELVDRMQDRTIKLVFASNQTLINALTNNAIVNTTFKFVACRSNNIIDWFGMGGASFFVMGRVTNGAYTSHVIIKQP